MTVPGVHLVDWRQQFLSMQEFLEHRGGVVQVVASDASPISTFAKAVRHRMRTERWPRPWCSVQIDGVNPNTHYMEDILVQLERSIGINGSPSQRMPARSVLVGTDVHAQSVEIRDVSISVEEGAFSRAEETLTRIDRVADAIHAAASERRVALIFVNSHAHDKRALTRFRNLVWDRALAALVPVGLLLIDIGDPARQQSDDWPPDPTSAFDLPERYDDASTADAIEDLTKIMLGEELFVSEAEARASARTLLVSYETVRELHAGLARSLARLSDG